MRQQPKETQKSNNMYAGYKHSLKTQIAEAGSKTELD